MKLALRPLNNVVAELKKLPYVNAVILFGSHARGTARLDSDVDIAVLIERPTARRLLLRSKLMGKSIVISSPQHNAVSLVQPLKQPLILP